METIDRRLAKIVPSQRQFVFQQTEFYAFIHFTVNTFTGKEWGDGKEKPEIFYPQALNAEQWVNAVKSAGMKGLILTCKHHDGFCLWPSQYTAHSVAASPYREGRGDIVQEVAEACRKGRIKFGVYLSPWDRNHPSYGTGQAYNDYFVNQLTELLTGYGEVFAVWFDGACGEGANGKRQAYDWNRYYQVIRKLQPNACINVCGPDIRWCGNEGGNTRESEWSVVPRRARDTEKIAENSQQGDNIEFRCRKMRASDRDLGSRAMLEGEKELIWYPAEVNTSIRPGWFYHQEEDGQVKSLEELFDIYLRSVGGNASFLLNIPPDKNGLIHPNDEARLKELGTLIQSAFSHNLLGQGKAAVDCWKPGHGIQSAFSDSYESWFQTPEHKASCEITINFPQTTPVTFVVLKEYILDSQRIERFSIWNEGHELLYRGTTVGYKKIVSLPQKPQVRTLRICIEDSRVYPTLAFLGIY